MLARLGSDVGRSERSELSRWVSDVGREVYTRGGGGKLDFRLILASLILASNWGHDTGRGSSVFPARQVGMFRPA